MQGKCHCGAVQFEVELSDGFNTVRRCTCSYCRMRGAVAVSAALGGLHVVRGEDKLTSYRFNTGQAQHFFCSRCGIYTHHQRRSIRTSSVSMLPVWTASAHSISPRCRSWTACNTPAITPANSDAPGPCDTSAGRHRFSREESGHTKCPRVPAPPTRARQRLERARQAAAASTFHHCRNHPHHRCYLRRSYPTQTMRPSAVKGAIHHWTWPLVKVASNKSSPSGATPWKLSDCKRPKFLICRT